MAFSKEIKSYLSLADKDIMMGFFYLGKVDLEIPLPQRDSVDKRVTWKK